MTLIGSTLYGTTQSGGTGSESGGGTVFSLPITGGTPTAMLSFTGSNGFDVIAGLTLSGTTFYGTTTSGGANGYGTLYSIGTNGTCYKDLFDFNAPNGNGPEGDLILSGSTLYGATDGGGAYGDGTIYEINTDGSGYEDLFDFNGTDGKSPNSRLHLDQRSMEQPRMVEPTHTVAPLAMARFSP